MDYEIDGTYEVTQTQEFSVNYNGSNYLVIYGQHINGGFIAIPNWEICTEASYPKDTFYNAEKLCRILDNPELSKVLAAAIKEHWESIGKTQEKPAEAKDKYTAQKCNRHGMPGYIFTQIHNGEKVNEYFVSENIYEKHCDAIGVKPEILAEKDGGPQRPHKPAHAHEREER